MTAVEQQVDTLKRRSSQSSVPGENEVDIALKSSYMFYYYTLEHWNTGTVKNGS